MSAEQAWAMLSEADSKSEVLFTEATDNEKSVGVNGTKRPIRKEAYRQARSCRGKFLIKENDPGPLPPMEEIKSGWVFECSADYGKGKRPRSLLKVAARRHTDDDFLVFDIGEVEDKDTGRRPFGDHRILALLWNLSRYSKGIKVKVEEISESALKQFKHSHHPYDKRYWNRLRQWKGNPGIEAEILLTPEYAQIFFPLAFERTLKFMGILYSLGEEYLWYAWGMNVYGPHALSEERALQEIFLTDTMLGGFLKEYEIS